MLGLPEHRGSGHLAVVGGGPSINDHIEELKAWPGQIWAVNGAYNWCRDHGIDAWFYTIDAQPLRVWFYPLENVKKAALAIDCDAEIFAKLIRDGAEVTTLPPSDGGPTSANAADWFSLEAGYAGVTWFGCEANYGDQTHAFASPDIPEWITIRVGGKDYRTKPEMMEQARVMSEVIRTVPKYYHDRSGGLLAAMVEHGMDYELVGISPAVEKKLMTRYEAMQIGA